MMEIVQSAALIYGCGCAGMGSLHDNGKVLFMTDHSFQAPTNVGVIGTGRMGYALAQRLLRLGHEVYVHNRTQERAMALVQEGAQVMESARGAVEASELILIMLSDADAIREALLAPASDLTLDGKVIIVLSTVASADSEELSSWVESRHGGYIEAPVMGGPSDILEGSAVVIVGAEDKLYKSCEHFLRSIAGELHHTGSVGSASVLKLSLNQFMAALVTALSTSVALVQSAGIPVETLMTILKKFPYYAPSYDSKLPRMLANDFSDPKFTINMMGKDVGLMVREAERHGVYAKALQAIHSLYEDASASGYGEEDYSAIYRSVCDPG